MPVVHMLPLSRPAQEVAKLGEFDMPPINMLRGRDIDHLLASLADLEKGSHTRLCAVVEVLLEDAEVLQTSGRISVVHRNEPGYSIITPDQCIRVTPYDDEIAPSWEYGETYVYVEGNVTMANHTIGDQVRIYPPRPPSQRLLRPVRL